MKEIWVCDSCLKEFYGLPCMYNIKTSLRYENINSTNFLIFPTLPKPFEHEFFCWIHSLFFSQLFIDTVWLTVTDKISEGKIRYGSFFFFFFQFPWKEETVTQKGYGGDVDEGVVNSLHLAPSQTHMIWCCFGHKLKGVYEFAKLFIILFDTSFDYLNPLC